LLDIRPHERRLVTAFVALSFLQGLSSVIGTAVGRSLFLEEFSPAQLPIAYAVVSVVLPVLGVLFVSVSRQVAARTLLAATAGLSGLIYASVWVALQLGFTRIGAGVAMVWVDIDWSLVLLVFLGLASHTLDVRQQRRLLGVAAAGDIVAGIGAGYLMPLILPLVGIGNLPLVASLAQCAAAAVVLGLLRGVEGARRPGTAPVAELLSDRFLRSAWALLALGWFAFYVIDAVFLSVASTHYPDPTALAGFLGVFLGTTAVADAVASLGLYGLLLGRFGVRGGLLGGPVSTGIFAGLLLLFAGAPTALLALGLASALKLADLTARENITEPAVSTLYSALPPGDRVAAQAIGSTVVGPVIGLLAAPALWFVMGPLELGLGGLATLALASLTATGLVALRIGDAWPKALNKAIERDAPVQADVTLTGAEGQEALIDGLMSPDPGLVVTAAGLLRRVSPRDLSSSLPALLSHRSTEVREGVARLLEEAPLPASEGKLAARMVDEPDMNVRALLYRALVATSPGVGLDLLEARTRLADLGERGAALDALIRHGDDRAEGLIDEGLARLQEGDRRERELAHHLAGRRKPLTDGDLLARMTRQSPWSLHEDLRRRRVAADQIIRVASTGWRALSESQTLRLATSVGVLAGDAARPMLTEMLADGRAAGAALAALRTEAELGPEEREPVRQSIERDLAAAPALRRRAEMRPDLLGRAALRADGDDALARVLLGFDLLHPGVGLGALWGPLQSEAGRPLALEILESVLSQRDWSRLEPLLPGTRAPLPLGGAIEGTLSNWTRLCLADPDRAAQEAQDFAPLRQVSFLADAPDRLLSELLGDSAVRKWIRDGADAAALPLRTRDILLIDHPAQRPGLLRALAGAAETASAPPETPGGVPAELEGRERLVALGTCPAFAWAPRSIKRMLVAAGTPHELQPRDVLFELGRRGGSAALVVSGSLDGRGAGSLLGLRSALAGSPRDHRWVASSRSQVLLLPRNALWHAASASGAVALGLAELLAAARAPGS
jgi:hypothetical protein